MKEENNKERNNRGLADIIIKKIEEEKMSPRPRWSFLLKDYFIWSFGFLSLFFGSITFSLVIYLFKSGDNIVAGSFGGSFWEIFLAVIPVFWLIFLFIFVFLSYLNIKNTKKAYKYSPSIIFLFSILCSVAFGTTFYLFGLSQKFDDLLGRNIHPFFYGRFMNPQVDFWSNPEDGRLAGVVLEINSEGNFLLIDIDSKKWLVRYSYSLNDEFLNLDVGLPVRCFGEKISDDEFKALKVMPMIPGKEMFNQPGFKRHFDDFRPKDSQPLKMMDVNSFMINN